MGKVAPRLVDKAMEWTGHGSQTTDHPERPGMRDNLYQAREDGDIYSSLPGEPRKTSLLLEAQLHPFVSAAILAGIAAGVAALFVAPLMGARRPRRPPRRRPVPRYQRTVRHSGNGHDKRVLGPGHVSQRSAREGRPQLRH